MLIKINLINQKNHNEKFFIYTVTRFTIDGIIKMKLYCTGLLVLVGLLSPTAYAGEAHVCVSKAITAEKQEQLSDETVFKCAGIKTGKNSFTINELAQNNWQIVSVNVEGVNAITTVPTIYHQVVIQKP